MNERYSKLFTLPENLYATGSPVVIAAGALLKDTQTGKVLAQLKLRNIGKKTIKAATVFVEPLDTVGKPLGAHVTYQYLDLHADRDADFGQKAPVALPDSATRSFAVSVVQVIFTDNAMWNADSAEWKPLSRPQPLDALGDDELTKQFRIEYGGGCENLLLEQKDLWHCVCGGVNRQEEANCHKCGKALTELQAIDMEGLRKKKEERVAKERAEAEVARKKAEIAAAKTKKIGMISAIALAILVVIVVAVNSISGMVKKNNAYNDALLLLENGQYEEAIQVFSALDGYKDSTEQIRYVEDIIAEMERVAELEAIYDNAIKLLESGVSAKENEAYYLLAELGDYKDAKNLLESFTYACIASGNRQYKYDSGGNLIEKDYGKYSYYYEYEDGHVVSEGQTNASWATKTYTYYPDGTLKSTAQGASQDSSGVVTKEIVYYNEKGDPEAVVYVRDNEPNKQKTWQFSYTYSDDSLITGLQLSFQNYGETEMLTKYVDFTEYSGHLSDIICGLDGNSILLYVTNANITYTEKYDLRAYSGSFYMRKDSEATITYDSAGKIDSKTTYYPKNDKKSTVHYFYDDQGNLIEERCNGIDGKLYSTKYKYAYIYTPDAV